jgi:hypothetical protein
MYLLGADYAVRVDQGDDGEQAVYEGVTRELAVGPRSLLNDLELLLVAERAACTVTPRASLHVEVRRMYPLHYPNVYGNGLSEQLGCNRMLMFVHPSRARSTSSHRLSHHGSGIVEQHG